MTVLKRITAAATLLASSAMLSGCLFQPGTFDATLHVQSDRQFTFAYEGEIVMAGMDQLAEMAQESEGTSSCYADDGFTERSCTDAEMADQAADDAMGRAMMESMMGGVDLSDPESIEEMTVTLERQAGWNSVEFVGDGKFMVDYSITSTLSHDYDFPTFEGMGMSSSFVQVRLREDNRVRIEAPGFAPMTGNPMAAMFLGMAGAFSEPMLIEKTETTSPPPEFPMPEGTFRIITDARILTNNTDEGPVDTAQGQVLTWDIGSGTSAPTALIEFAP